MKRSTVFHGKVSNAKSPRQNSIVASVPKTTKRSIRKRLPWLAIFVCAGLIWNNLSWGQRSILSTVDFSDAPKETWNNTTSQRPPKCSHEIENCATRVNNPRQSDTMDNVVKFPDFLESSSIDPYSLKNGIASFLMDHRSSDAPSDSRDMGGNPQWSLLERYPVVISQSTQQFDQQFFYYEHEEISSELICGSGPGRGMEQDAGYKLLVEKIRLVETPQITSKRHRPKLLCLVYTYSPMRHLVRAQALMWGRHCDGFLAFSNETLPELGIYQLPPSDHEREESYNNMWQKSRGIWKFVHDHFLDTFDYFYISGDDVYLVVDNLRAYLQDLESEDNTTARHFGSWLPKKSMVAGGPGYLLNRAALLRYVGIDVSSNDTTSVWSTCRADTHRPYEDRYLSECLSKDLGIWGNDTDTRDPSTGEQRFHDTDPATLYLFRASSHKSASYFSRMAKAWEDQAMPGSQTPNAGPKHGLEAAAKHSISLHRLYTPTYMARIHTILHRVCPIDSPLGRGLETYRLSDDHHA